MSENGKAPRSYQISQSFSKSELLVNNSLAQNALVNMIICAESELLAMVGKEQFIDIMELSMRLAMEDIEEVKKRR